MTKTYTIAKLYKSGTNGLHFQLDKPSKVPESLFHVLLEDQLRLLLHDVPEKFDESMATIMGHLDQEKRENAISVHNLTFTILTRK